MDKLFSIGDVIDGYCNGYFGRDDYDKKICIMVRPEYVIFQYIGGLMEGKAVTLNSSNNNPTEEEIANWKKEATF